MCQQTIVLRGGQLLTGHLVSWEANGAAIVRRGQRDYLGTRAEVHARRMAAATQTEGAATARSSIGRQHKVVA